MDVGGFTSNPWPALWALERLRDGTARHGKARPGQAPPYNMLSPEDCLTTLLDLPPEVLSRCVPWEADPEHPRPIARRVQPLMAASKQMFGTLVDMVSPGQVYLRLQIQDHDDVASSIATLRRMLRSLPGLRKLWIESCSSPYKDGLTSLLEELACAEGLEAGWPFNITHLCLKRPWDHQKHCMDGILLLPQLLPVSVATTFPYLKELKLDGVVISEWLYRELLTNGVEQRTQKQLKQAQKALRDDASLWKHAKPRLQAVQKQAVTGPTSTVPATLPHLQCLKLRSCSLWGCAPALQQQVLPCLKELSFEHCKFISDAAEGEYAAAVADSCSAQLVSLQWDYLNGETWLTNEARYMPALLSKPYSQLQQLHARYAIIFDDIMELLLLQTPNLKRLQVEGFRLTGDFSSRQCIWEAVVMLSDIDVASLARMPLSSRPNIRAAQWVVHGSSPELRVQDGVTVYCASAGWRTGSDDLQLTAAAAAAVGRCGGIRFAEAPGGLGGCCATGKITLHAQQGGNMPDDGRTTQGLAYKGKMVMATLPMLSNIVHSLVLDFVHVTKGLLAATSSHLPLCQNVEFGTPCTFEKGIWGDMVSLLPRVKVLTVREATLQQLVELCAAATRPVTLQVSSKFRSFTLLQKAQRDAGHSYVELVADEENLGGDCDDQDTLVEECERQFVTPLRARRKQHQPQRLII